MSDYCLSSKATICSKSDIEELTGKSLKFTEILEAALLQAEDFKEIQELVFDIREIAHETIEANKVTHFLIFFTADH